MSRKQGNSDVSLSRHKEALKHYISLGNARWAARTYNNIGYLLRRKNERSKALEAYGEVEAILESSNDDDLIYSQITLARSLIELGEVDRAREHAMASHERTSELVIACSTLVRRPSWAGITQRSSNQSWHCSIIPKP